MKSVQAIYESKRSQINSIMKDRLSVLRSYNFKDVLTPAISTEQVNENVGLTSKSGSGLADVINLFNSDGVYDSTALIEAYLRSAQTATYKSVDVPDDSFATAYDDIINEAAADTGLSAALIKGLIKAESNFNPNAVSSSGAQGLTQLMPSTAKALGVTDAFDPKQNIEAGAAYLKKQIDRCGGDVRMALAAYNAGYYRLKELGIESSGGAEYSLLSEQTRGYVEKVLKYSGAA